MERTRKIVEERRWKRRTDENNFKNCNRKIIEE